MRRIVFIVYPGFQLLDLAGAAAVLSGALDRDARLYEVTSVSMTGGAVLSGSGIAVQTAATGQTVFAATDTVIVPGAVQDVLRRAMADAELIATLQAAAGTAERIAAVSTGSFLLAAAGLLDERNAATFWATSTEFAAAFPRVALQSEPIFVEDGGVWTSAGTTTGIDMALEMVKRDHGNAPAHDVARILRGRRARLRARD